MIHLKQLNNGMRRAFKDKRFKCKKVKRNQAMSLYDERPEQKPNERQHQPAKEKIKTWNKWRIPMIKKALLFISMLIMTFVPAMSGNVNAAVDSEVYSFNVSNVSKSYMYGTTGEAGATATILPGEYVVSSNVSYANSYIQVKKGSSVIAYTERNKDQRTSFTAVDGETYRVIFYNPNTTYWYDLKCDGTPNYKVGSTYYPTLEMAIGAVSSGGTITVNRTHTDSSDAIVDKTVILDTNGYTITKKKKTITVNSGKTLKITGTGTIQSKTEINVITNNGTVTLADATIAHTMQTTSYKAIYNTGKLTINSGNVLSESYSIDNRGTIIVNGGTIKAESEFSGIVRAIYNKENANLSIYDGTISAINTLNSSSASSRAVVGEGSIIVNGGSLLADAYDALAIAISSSASSTTSIGINGGTIEARSSYTGGTAKVVSINGVSGSKLSVPLTMTEGNLIAKAVTPANAHGMYISYNTGTIKIIGGNITSEGTGIFSGNTANTLIIGSASKVLNNLNDSDLVIEGKICGVETPKEFNFNNGIIIGSVDTPYIGTANPRANCEIYDVRVGNEYTMVYLVAFQNYQVNENFYANLHDAIAAAQSGDIIGVLKTNTDTSSAVIDKNVSIHTNGFTVTKNTSSIIINSGVSVEIIGTGKLTTSEKINVITNNGNLYIENSTIENTADGNAVTYTTIRNNGKLYANGGIVLGKEHAIQNDGELVIDGGIIKSESSYDGYMRAILNIDSDSKVTINSGSIIAINTSTSSSSYTRTIHGSGTITINGGEIIAEGYSAYAIGLRTDTGYANSTIKVNGGKITATNTVSGGSAICINTQGNSNFRLTAPVEVLGGELTAKAVIKANAYGIYSAYNNGEVKFINGTIDAEGRGINVGKTGAALTIGSEDAELSKDNPVIKGGTHGVYSPNGFTFNNGAIRGRESKPYSVDPTIRPGNYTIITVGPHEEGLYTSYIEDLDNYMIVETGAKYFTLEDAVAAAGANNTIRVLNDNFTDTSAVTINKSLTLDTNGKYFIKATNSIVINSGCEVLIIGDGIIDNATCSTFINYGTITTSGLEIINNSLTSSHYPFVNGTGAKLFIYDTDITTKFRAVENSGIVHFHSGIMTVTNAYSSGYLYGVVSYAGSEFTMYDGTIKVTNTATSTNAIAVESHGRTTIIAGKIYSSGYGISYSNSSTVYVGRDEDGLGIYTPEITADLIALNAYNGTSFYFQNGSMRYKSTVYNITPSTRENNTYSIETIPQDSEGYYRAYLIKERNYLTSGCYFTTLQQAADYASNNGTITVVNTAGFVDASAPVINKNLTIDTAQTGISKMDHVITIEEGYTVNLIGGGTFGGGTNTRIVKNKGTLNLLSAQIYSQDPTIDFYGGIDNEGTLNITGGSVRGDRGAVLNKGILNLEESGQIIVESGIAEDFLIGIYVYEGSKTYINGGTINLNYTGTTYGSRGIYGVGGDIYFNSGKIMVNGRDSIGIELYNVEGRTGSINISKDALIEAKGALSIGVKMTGLNGSNATYTLNTEGTIKAETYGVYTSYYDGTIQVTGGSISGAYVGIQTENSNGLIQVTNGSVYGASSGINVSDTGNTLIYIGSEETPVSKEAPVISAELFGINASRFYFYNGAIVGGRSTPYSVENEIITRPAYGININGPTEGKYTAYLARLLDSISEIPNQIFNKGLEIKPTPVVQADGVVLVNGVGYTLSYENNINVGTATVTATGIGDYTGQLTREFIIDPYTLTDSMVILDPVSFIYDGSDKTPTLTVKHDDKTLIKDTDYAVSGTTTAANANSYSITVNGNGNYTGSINKGWSIEKQTINKPSGATLIYTGSEQTGVIPGTGYNLSGTTKATNVGTYEATATPTSNYKWSDGTTTAKTITWSIGAKSLTDTSVTVKLEPTYFEYDGTDKTPGLTVKDGTVTLAKDTDYTVSGTQTAKDAGAYKITVTGKGNYKDSVERTWSIGEKIITGDVVISGTATYGNTLSSTISNLNPSDANKSYQWYVADSSTAAGSPLSNETNSTLELKSSQIGKYVYLVVTASKTNYTTAQLKSNVVGPIGKRAVTVTAGSTSKVYDGTALTYKSATANITLPYGDKLDTPTMTSGSTITNVGEVANTISSIKILSSSGVDVTKYYDITTVAGKLTITAASLSSIDEIANQIYTGSAITPTVVVKSNSKTLTLNTDYTLSYTSNTTVGTATVTATGKGNYKGSVSTTFKIVAKSLTDSSISASLSQTSFTFTGSAIKPTASVKDNTKGLVLGTDYAVTYSNNTNVGSASDSTVANRPTVTITGQGNYTGEIKLYFSITNATLSVTLTPYSNEYDGLEHTIGVSAPTGSTIKYGTSAGTYNLAEAPKYINVGTYTVYIQVSKDNYTTYTGSAKVTITAKSITVTWGNTSLTYTGSTQAPVVDGDNKINGVNGEVINVKVDGAKTNVGTGYTASINTTNTTVTGGQASLSNYLLSPLSTSFEIVVNQGKTFTISEVTAVTYNGSEHKPTPTVKDGNTTLILDTDYTLSYSNNKNAGTGKITVTGKGNYLGINGSKNFTINPRTLIYTPTAGQSKVYGTANPTLTGSFSGNIDSSNPGVSGSLTRETGENVGKYKILQGTLALANNGTFIASNYTLSFTTGVEFEITRKNITELSLSLAQATYTYNGAENKPGVNGSYNGSALKVGTDYDVTYKNNVNVGLATATIAGKGNFSGSKELTFTINAKPVEVVWGTTTFTYDGTDKLPTATATSGVTGETITLYVTGAQKLEGTGYTATVNVSKSTVTGGQANIGNYSLSPLTTTFSIGAKSIAGAVITLNPNSFVYNGIAQSPDTITVVLDGVTLSKGTDYTVNYTNNVNVGTAVATVTGKGNYSGTETKNYSITVATPNITLKDKEAMYSGVAISIDTATVTGVANGTTPSGTITYTYYMDSECTVKTPTTTGASTVGGAPVNVGTYYVKASIAAEGNYGANTSSAATLTITPKLMNNTSIKATLNPTSYVYDGTVKKPEVTVKDGTATLALGKDYTVTYDTSTTAKDVGIKIVTVTGKGNYSGSVYPEFTITVASTNVTVTITGTNQVGKTLTATTITGSDGVKSYKWWYSDSASATTGTAISGATSNTYIVTEAMSGKYVGVTVEVAAGTNYGACSGNAKVLISVANYTDGTNYYTTLEEAFDNAPTGSTIKVLQNVTDTSDAQIDNGKSFTLNLNGKTITKTTKTITNNGTLTVIGNGKIAGSNLNAITNNATLTIGKASDALSATNPEISGGEYGIYSTTSFTFNNGVIKGTKAVPYAGTLIPRTEKHTVIISKSGSIYSAYLVLDEVAPEITITPNGSSNWSKSYNVTINVVDSISPLSKLKYQWTQSLSAPAESSFDTNGTNFTNGETITKNTGNGNNWYLWVIAEDTAKNTSIVGSEAFYLDNEKPKVEVDKTSVTYGEKVVLTMTDNYSGIVGWQITENNSVPTDWNDVTKSNNVTVEQLMNEAGTWYAWTKDAIGNVSNSVEITVNTKSIASSNIEITLNKYVFQYTGSEIKPIETVKDIVNGNTVTLVKGTHYQVSYINNINVGTAAVVITGIGDYSGENSVDFIINTDEIADDENIVDLTGPAIKNLQGIVTTIITVDTNITDPDIAEGIPGSGVNEAETRYAMTKDNVKPSADSSLWQVSNEFARTDDEIIYVWVKAVDNVGNISIAGASSINNIHISTLNIIITPDDRVFEYDGTPKVLSVVIKDGDRTLVKDTDYTVDFENNVNAGTAAMVITGTSLHTGTVRVEYEITKKNLYVTPTANQSMTYGDTLDIKYTYSGNLDNQTPKFEGALSLIGGEELGAGTYKVGKGTLKLVDNIPFLANNYNLVVSEDEVVFTINPKVINSGNVTLGQREYVYDGTAKEPSVLVTVNGNPLVEGIDYKVTYENNVNVGSATDTNVANRPTVKIEGIGNYSGTINEYFTITERALKLSITGYNGTYDGEAHGVSISGSDYATSTITYDTNISDGKYDMTTAPTFTDAGTYTVYVKAEKANFETYTTSVVITINPKTVTVIWGSSVLTYEAGKYQAPSASVSTGITNETITLNISGKQMDVGPLAGQEYKAIATIASVNKTNGGNGKASNYVLDRAEKNFSIVLDATATFEYGLKDDSIEYVYDGTFHTPAIEVKSGGLDLIEGTDYTAEYANNKNAGTATITITGKGNYAGREEVITFEIKKRALNVVPKANQTVEYGNAIPTLEYDYNGNVTSEYPSFAGALYVKIPAGSTIRNIGEAGEYLITQNTLTLNDNSPFLANNYNIVFDDTVIFTISQKSINTLTVNLDESTFTYDGTAKEPKAQIIVNGKTLVENTDFTLSYTNNIDASTAGNIPTVKVTGINNYTGSKTIAFTINPKEIVVEWGDTELKYVSGKAQAPTAGTNNTMQGVNGETIYLNVSGAETNVGPQAGDEYIATATIASVKKLGGEDGKTSNYTLTNASTAFKIVLSSGYNVTLVDPNDSTVEYTGLPHTPEVIVKVGDTTLVEGTDYEINYEDNTNAGTATIVVTGKGNYDGIEEELKFIIEPKVINVTWGNTKLPYTGDYQAPGAGTNNTLAGVNDEIINLSINGAEKEVGPIGGAEYKAKAEMTSVKKKDNTAGLTSNYTLRNAEVLFEIVVNSDLKFNVSLSNSSEKSVVYKGTAYMPEVIVSLADGTVLTQNTDYTVGYSNNIDVGTATITVTGMKNYAGITSGTTFEITPKPIAVIWNDTTLIYNGTAQVPTAGTNNVMSGVNNEKVYLSISGAKTNVGPRAGEEYIATASILKVEKAGGATGSIANYKLTNETTSFEITLTEGAEFDVTLVNPDDANVTYTGGEHRPEVIVKVGNTVLEKGLDYDVDYDGNIDAGTAKIIITGKGNYDNVTGEATFVINPKQVTVVWGNRSFVYDGTSKVPTATVETGIANETINLVADGAQTEVGDNYVASVNMTATTVTGGRANLNNYSLTNATTTFNITVPSVDFKPTLDNDEFEYDGEEQKPNVTITVIINGEEVELEEGKDFEVKYENNIDAGTDDTKPTIIIEGIGNYEGIDKEIEFTINRKDITITPNAGQSKVFGTSDPIFTYTYSGQVSGETVDFSGKLSRVGGESVGTYTITQGDLAFIDTASFKASNYNLVFTENVLFTINGKSIADSDVDITLDDTVYDYTGKEIKPGVTIEVVIDGEEVTLVEGDDFDIDYDANIDAGEATVIITGKGDYTGTVELKFTIEPKKVAVVWGDLVLDYTRNPQVPAAVVVTGIDGETIDLVIVEAKTEVGKDYPASVDMSATTVTGGRGKLTNYELTNTTAKFEIKLADNVEFNPSLDNDVLEYNGQYQEPEVTVKVTINGQEVTLEEGKDYEVDYEDNKDVGTGTVTITGKGNYEGLEEVIEFTIVKKDIIVTPNAGQNKVFGEEDPEFTYTYTEAVSGEEIAFSGKLEREEGKNAGTYPITKGTLVLVNTATLKVSNYNLVFTNGVTFEITRKDLSEGTLTIESSLIEYDGTPKTPDTEVKLEGEILVRDQDYQVIYVDNTEMGKATVVIEGIGNYKGEITGTFTIGSLDVADGILILNPNTFVYDGTEKKPSTILILNEMELKLGQDYEVTYHNNINVGDNTAYVIAKGKGIYRGEIRATFSITPRVISGTVTLDEYNYEYDNTEKKPIPTVVTDEGKTLVEGIDYEVTYRDNVNAGTASVVITGIGNYTSTIEVTFIIEKAYIRIQLKDKYAPYTGNEIAIDEPIIDGAYTDVSSLVVYKYYSENDLNTVMETLPKEMGIYYVDAMIVDANNYYDSIASRVKLVIYGAPTKPEVFAKDGDDLLESGAATSNDVEVIISGSLIPNVNTLEIGYKYSFDGVTWNEYQGPVELSNEGVITIYAKAYVKDEPTLESEVVEFIITIDRTEPVINDVIVPDVSYGPVVDVEVNGEDLDKVLITTDPTIDPKNEDLLDDWKELDENDKTIIEVDKGDGEKPIYVWGKDEAGNITGPFDATIIINALKLGNQNDNKTTIMFKVTDKYLHTSDVKPENILLYVNDMLNPGKVTSISKEEITEGYKYTAIIENVTGDGELDIALVSGDIYDKAGNAIEDAKAKTNEITVDNTLPVVNVSKQGQNVYIVAKDDHMKAIMVNGKIIGRTNGEYLYELQPGLNKVFVIDEYGNEVVHEITNEIAVTYNANGGENAPSVQIKKKNVALKLTDEIPTLYGHNFLGWSSAKNSKVITYRPGDIYTEEDNLILYAVWEAKRYTILYDANGAGQVPESQIKVHNIPITLSSEEGVREGYEFKGWSISADGDVTYQPGDTYVAEGDATLYAVFYPIIKGRVTINGNMVYGETLTANMNGLWPADANLAYQWYSNDNATITGGNPISGAIEKTYVIGNGLIGKYIYVVVEATGDKYIASTFNDITDNATNGTERVIKRDVAKPIGTTVTYTYDGYEKTLGVSRFDANVMNITGNKETNAGNHTATISLKDTANYQWPDGSTGDVTIGWTITSITNTLSVTGKSGLTYKGSAQELVDVVNAQGDVYYAIGTELTASNYTAGSKEIPTATNADTYVVYYYTPGNTNYNAKSGNVTVTIAKVKLTKPSASTTSYAYNGNQRTLGISGFDGNTMNVSGNTGTNVDNYTAIISIKDTINYQWSTGGAANITIAWTITAIENTLAISAKTGLAYNGGAQELVTVSNAQGKVYYKIGTELTASNYTSGSETIPTATNANTYVVYYYTPGNQNYNAKRGNVTVTIAKISLTKPSASTTSYAYSGSQRTLGVSGFDGNTMSISGNTGTNAGDYTATISLKDTTNYQWSGGSTSNVTIGWKITKISLTKPSASTTSYAYNGSQRTLGVSGFDGNTMNISGNTGTNAGDYTATISLKDTVNYQWSGGGTGNVTIGWTITKIANTLSVSGRSGLTYNGSAHALATASGAQGTVYYKVGTQLTSSNYTSGSTSIPTSVNAGTFTVYYYTPGNTNYNAASGNVKTTIAKITLTKPTGATTSFAYNGSARSVGLNNFNSSTMNISGNTATNAGSYTATISLKDTTNYQWSDGSTSNVTISWSITKIANTLSVSGRGTLTYNGSAQALATASGAQGTVYYKVGTQLTSSNYTSGSTSIPTSTNAGSFTVYYYTPGNTNYNAKSGSVSTTIAKVSLTKPTGSTTSFAYNGSQRSVGLSGFNSSTMNISGNTATNAGSYTATISLKSTTNYQWSDGSTSNVTIGWKITKVSLTKPTVSTTEYTHTGSAITLGISNLNTSTMNVSGNVQTNVGSYTATVSLKDTTNYQWSDGSTSNITFSWRIKQSTVVLDMSVTQSGGYDGSSGGSRDFSVDITGAKTLAFDLSWYGYGGEYEMAFSVGQGDNAILRLWQHRIEREGLAWAYDFENLGANPARITLDVSAYTGEMGFGMYSWAGYDDLGSKCGFTISNITLYY